MDATTLETRKIVPWELVYAGDLVLAVSEQEALEVFDRCREGMETIGLKVKWKKQKY